VTIQDNLVMQTTGILHTRMPQDMLLDSEMLTINSYLPCNWTNRTWHPWPPM